MKAALDALPPAVRDAVDGLVATGETPIWAGRPTLRLDWASLEQPAPGERVRMPATGIVGRVVQDGIIVALSLLLVPLGCAIAAYAILEPGSAEGLVAAARQLALLALGGGLAGAGLYGFLAPLGDRLQLMRTWYLLTDRHAHLLRHGSGQVTRTLCAAGTLAVALLAIALAIGVALAGVLALVGSDIRFDGAPESFVFGAGCLLVILGAGLLVAHAGWSRLPGAWRALLEAVHGATSGLERRTFDVGDLDGRTIRVKREGRSGIGDLVFADDGYHGRLAAGIEGGGAVEVDVGFLSVEGARDLERILRSVCARRIAG